MGKAAHRFIWIHVFPLQLDYALYIWIKIIKCCLIYQWLITSERSPWTCDHFCLFWHCHQNQQRHSHALALKVSGSNLTKYMLIGNWQLDLNWFLLACSFACHFSILGRLCLWFGVCFLLFTFCILMSLFIIDTEKMYQEENGAILVRKSVSSVTQSCLTLCNPTDRITAGFPVRHQLPELTQTHVHQVGDAIQPSHSLSSLSPPPFNLSKH